MTIVYKIVPASLWREAERKGVFEGAAIDLTDGFIHFSTGPQAQETADKHFRGQSDLLLVAVEAEAFGDSMKWEVSRGGALFPHLYAPLEISAALSVARIPDGGGKPDLSGLLK